MGAGVADSDDAAGTDSAGVASARAGVPGRANSVAAGSVLLGAAPGAATAFFNRMRRSRAHIRIPQAHAGS